MFAIALALALAVAADVRPQPAGEGAEGEGDDEDEEERRARRRDDEVDLDLLGVLNDEHERDDRDDDRGVEAPTPVLLRSLAGKRSLPKMGWSWYRTASWSRRATPI